MNGVLIEPGSVPASSAGWPDEDAGPAEERREIFVILTCPESAEPALQAAGALALRLNARITIVVPQIVQFPVPLSVPPVLRGWNENRYRRIAGKCPVETRVHIFLCRDPGATVLRILTRGSIVVLAGAKRRWWPSAEERLARRLRRAGHHVHFVPAA